MGLMKTLKTRLECELPLTWREWNFAWRSDGPFKVTVEETNSLFRDLDAAVARGEMEDIFQGNCR